MTSKYNRKKRFKPYNIDTNTEKTPNLLNQKFDGYTTNQVITSNLTYVPFKNGFLYICFLLDLSNREIVGFSTSDKHNTEVVLKAFEKSNIDYKKMSIFHSDRGGEFNGQKLSDMLSRYDIERSLSKPGCPFDNAPSEKLFDIFKTEWMKKSYSDIIVFNNDVKDFVTWYNYFRIHSSIEYQTPVEKRLKNKE